MERGTYGISVMLKVKKTTSAPTRIPLLISSLLDMIVIRTLERRTAISYTQKQ
jgi:hypothetical protein